MSVKKEMFKYLDSLADNKIVSGWEIAESLRTATGKHTYPSTLLGYCREYCDITGGRWECLDNQKSIYKFHKGVILLGGCSPQGRE
jgi:hypothetical protein